MSRRGVGGSLLPILGLVILSLTIIIGVIIFGASMTSAYIESNYTATNSTLIPYEINTAWWVGVAAILLILALAFSLWYFWGR